jgi:hypothetical protein
MVGLVWHLHTIAVVNLGAHSVLRMMAQEVGNYEVFMAGR